MRLVEALELIVKGQNVPIFNTGLVEEKRVVTRKGKTHVQTYRVKRDQKRDKAAKPKQAQASMFDPASAAPEPKQTQTSMFDAPQQDTQASLFDTFQKITKKPKAQPKQTPTESVYAPEDEPSTHTYARNIYDEIVRRLERGVSVDIKTALKVTRFTSVDQLEHSLRLNGSSIRLREGKNWGHVTGHELAALANALGVEKPPLSKQETEKRAKFEQALDKEVAEQKEEEAIIAELKQLLGDDFYEDEAYQAVDNMDDLRAYASAKKRIKPEIEPATLPQPMQDYLGRLLHKPKRDYAEKLAHAYQEGAELPEIPDSVSEKAAHKVQDRVAKYMEPSKVRAEPNDKPNDKPNVSSAPIQAAIKDDAEEPLVGLPSDATKAKRIKWNIKAKALSDRLEEEGRAATLEEKRVLGRYSGTGGVGSNLNEFYTPPEVAQQIWAGLANMGATKTPDLERLKVLEPSAGTGVMMQHAPDYAAIDAVELSPVSSKINAQIFDKHRVKNGTFESFYTGDDFTPQYDVVVGNPPFGVREDSSLDMPDERRHERYFTLRALHALKAGGTAALVLPHGVLSNKGKEAKEFRRKLLANAEFVHASALPSSAFSRADTEAAATDVLYFRKRNPDVARALEGLPLSALEALGVHNEAFVSGNYYEENPHGLAEDKPGTMWYKRLGELKDALPSVSKTPNMTQKLHSLDELLNALDGDEGLQAKANSLALGKAAKKEGQFRTDERSGNLQVCRNGRWHNVEDETNMQAFNQGRALSEQLKLHATLLANADTDTANALRPKLKKLLEAYRDEHGLPSDNEDLKRALKETSALNALMGAFDDQGEVKPHYASDAVTQRFDPQDIAQAFKRARRQGPVTLRTLYAHFEHQQGDEETAQLLREKGFAFDVDGTIKPQDELYSGQAYKLIDALSKARDNASGYLKDIYAQQIDDVRALMPEKALEDMNLTPTLNWIPDAWIKEYLEYYTLNIGQTVRARHIEWEMNENGERVMGKPSYATSSRGFNLIKRYLTGKGKRKDEFEQYAEIDEGFAAWLSTSGLREEAQEMYMRRGGDWLTPTYSGAPLDIEGWNPDIVLHPWQNESVRRIAAQGSGIVALDVGLGKTLAAIAEVLHAKQNGLAKRPVIAVPKSVVANWRQKFFKAKPDANILVVGAEPELDDKGNAVLDEDGNEVWNPVEGKVALDRQLAQMVSGDYDAVLMTQTTLGRLEIDRERQLELTEHEFGMQRDDFVKPSGMPNSAFKDYAAAKVKTLLDKGEVSLDDLDAAAAEVKRLNKEIKDLNAISYMSSSQEASKKEKQERRARASFLAKAAKKLKTRDISLDTTWESLGVDKLVVDEAHSMKGLWEPTGSRTSVKYLGAGQASSQAMSFYYKTKELQARTGGRGVTLLTATPLKNSPVELYNMMSYVAPHIFQQQGIVNLDKFIERYCKIESESFPTEDGEFKDVLVLAGLKNLNELRAATASYINRKTAEGVGLPLPEKDTNYAFHNPEANQREIIASIMSDPVDALRDYMGKEYGVGDDESADEEEFLANHRLALLHLMRRAELDLEMIDPKKYKGHVSPKVKALMSDLKEQVGSGEKAVIFCDNKDFPDPQGRLEGNEKKNPNGYSFHDKLKKLIVKETGLEPHEVAIVNADKAKSAEDRQRIAESLKAGGVKVVLGNTATMGQGINLQHGVKNLWHLDVPWNPADLQQREGRVVRQGNKLGAVNNRFYLGTRGLDPMMVDILGGKTNWYNEFWDGDTDVMSANTQNLVPSAEAISAMAIDDDDERESALAAIKQKDAAAATHASHVKDVAMAQKYFKLRSVAAVHARKYGDDASKKSERESLQRQLERAKNKLSSSGFFASKENKDALDSDTVAFHPTSLTRLEVGKKYTVKNQWRTQHYIIDAYHPAKQSIEMRVLSEKGEPLHNPQKYALNKLGETNPYEGPVVAKALASLTDTFRSLR